MSVNFEELNDFSNPEDLDFGRTVTTANNLVIPPARIQFANELDLQNKLKSSTLTVFKIKKVE